jgi:uncharacterized protein (DUF1501 family)
MPLNRRQLLGHSAALLGATALPLRRALAASAAGEGMKFVFVVNYGGWDPTRVFADEFWNANVDMEPSAEPLELGGLTYVTHPDRPAVDTFFERYGELALIMKGIQVPSVAHENCLRLVMTGSTSSERADWPSILGYAKAADFALPHLVIQGPAFPGYAGSAVTRTGSSGQFEGLLDGSIIDWSDLQTGRPNTRGESAMDEYLSRRLAAVAETYSSESLRGRAAYYKVAQQRAEELKTLADVLNWSGGSSLAGQIDLAVDALSMGISRCTMLSSGYGWDSHTDNDDIQSGNFQSLFSELIDLMDKLAAAPGTHAAKLIDETVVVVLSEMGRTPQLNADEGKDHWPYTSAMIVGPNVTGGRVVGAYDNYYYGRRINRETGEIDDDGHDLNVEEFGATLLLLAGADPNDFLTGVQGISGVVAG